MPPLHQLRRYALLLLVALATLALPRTSWADDAAATFKEGRTLYDAKRYEEALPKFETALASSQSPNARLYVARCLRELGRLDEAFSAMQHTVRDARDKAQQDAYYAQTRDTAATELAQLDKRVGKLVITLGEDLRGAKVRLGSRPLTAEQIGVPVAVLPGDAVVEATAADGTKVRRAMTIEAGDTKAIMLMRNGAGAADATSGESEAETSADTGPGFGIVRALGVGVAAAGVAGVVMFGVFNAQADDKLAQLEAECGGARCTDPAYADVVDEGKRAETIATASLVVGIAAVLGGTAMIIFGGPSDDGPGDDDTSDDGPTEVTIIPTAAFTPQGGMAGMVIRF